jgi:hypothetical protein
MVNSHINFRYAKSIEDFRKEIKRFRKLISNNDFIYGGYFSDANFKEKLVVNKVFLDFLCYDIPMVILRNDLHSCVLNSTAIEILNVDNILWKSPPEESLKDENGNLTGEFRENAFTYIRNAVPKKSLEAKSDILKNQIEKLHKFGVAGVSDITFVEDLEIYKFLLNKNELNLKIDSRLPYEEFNNRLKYEKEFEAFSQYIKFKSFKAFYDGSLSSETAYFKNNYKNKNHRGIRTNLAEDGELAAFTHLICNLGYQPSIHAIGDEAVSEVLDIFNDVLWLNPSKEKYKLRIEHAQHIDPFDFDKFDKDNIILSVQPAHLWFDVPIALEKLDNPETTHNYKKLFDKGIRVCFGTDSPVVTENPFETIYYAMTRKVEGYPFGFYPENCFDLVSCLQAYTFNNAYASYDELGRGNIEIGKAADLIVMKDDLFIMNENEIRNAEVEMTYFNGKRVY